MPISIQDNARTENRHRRLLLQLCADDLLYWPFGYCGVQFWMALADLGERHWQNVAMTVEPH